MQIEMQNEKIEALQRTIQQIADKRISDGLEDGLQVTAYQRGKKIVQVSAGLANPVTGQAVNDQTLFMSMSTAKAVTATVIHQLAQARKLDYDEPVASYWPAFAANGKARITIRQILCHTAGVPQMPSHVTVDMVCDWGTMLKEIEKLKPIWEPGTKTGYHGLTYGWILGEVIQHIEGRPFSQIVRDKICQPLGIEDQLFFGVPEEHESRIARTIGGKQLFLYWLPFFPLFKKAVPARLVPMGNPAWDQARFQRAVFPSGPAVMTSNALARFFAALIGEVDGVRLLSPEQLKLATTLQTAGPDKVLVGSPIPKALGYWLGNNQSAQAMGNDPRSFGNTGLGGLIGFADPTRQLSFALMKNRMTFRDEDTDCLLANALRRTIDS